MTALRQRRARWAPAVVLAVGLAAVAPRVAGGTRTPGSRAPVGERPSRVRAVLTPPSPVPSAPARLASDGLAFLDGTLSDDRRAPLHTVCPAELPRPCVPLGPELVDPPVDWPSPVDLLPRRAPRAPPAI